MKDFFIGCAATIGLLWFCFLLTVVYLQDMGAWVK